jgi:hypothetical protein
MIAGPVADRPIRPRFTYPRGFPLRCRRSRKAESWRGGTRRVQTVTQSASYMSYKFIHVGREIRDLYK